MRVFKILATVLPALWIIACGQTGPLYLPGSAAPVHVPKEQREESQEENQENEENQEEEQQ